MNPSKLNKRIILERKSSETKDEEGNAIPSEWKEFVKVWAEAKTPFGTGFKSEIFQGNAEFVIKLINFTIRYRKGINSAMRARYDGKLYEIKSVIDIDEQHKEMCLICEERSNWQN
ncbi:head-tail adaptor protein [Bacillus toyonensis]|uniref:phage head closure protein n=1 Tax=Bacillus toyonensis TaxID=155322 RepID=UPI00088F3517|nr:phage head closure protein [Bacillus toyonensis]PGC57834.1 head-tail adaptor protein [Bacillus toyonensis]SDK24544.1 phage head-tail adaptor, putative, SPP1 family [Bacillus toyonensis]